jgi:hypothetical protein
MEALGPSEWSELNQADDLHSKMLPATNALADTHCLNLGEQSALTSSLLTDLSETCLRQIGDDPLARFETKVALISGRSCILEADPKRHLILVSEAFIAAMEFAVANAALTNLISKLKHITNRSTEHPELAASLRNAQTTMYAMFQGHLLLHMTGEKAAPSICPLLPAEYRVFVHEQLALCLSFALLHEQAHIEFASGVDIAVHGLARVGRFARTVDSPDQLEEHAADAWAVEQVQPSGRARITKSASFFFLNQWFYDYMSYSEGGSHPPALNRLQFINSLADDLKTEDPTFSEIMLKDLNKQHHLRTALDRRERWDRYAKALRYARRISAFQDYPAMVNAVCQAYEEFCA